MGAVLLYCTLSVPPSTYRQGTGFSPTVEQLQSMVATMFDSMITTVNTVNRVLYLKVFHEKVATVVRNGPVVSGIIRASQQFQAISTGDE